MLHIDSISKYFGTKALLQDIYISCSPNEVVGILGRNGSGKSTLLKIVARQENADHSYIKVNEEVLLTTRRTARYINYLPQASMLPSQEKVKTILEITLADNQYHKIAKHPLIAPLLDTNCSALSGGESRFIETLIVLLASTPYTLLDEPFSGISPLLRDEIIRMIKQRKQPKGILLTDHDYRNVLKVADKIFLIQKGKSILINHKDELIHYGYLVR